MMAATHMRHPMRGKTRAFIVRATALLCLGCGMSAAAVAELKGISPRAQKVEFKSTNPRYARIAMNDDGSTTLALALDESGGAGKGYDTVYILELDDQGAIIKHEQNRASRSTDGDVAIYAFKPVSKPVAFKKDMKPGKAPFSASIEYRRTEIDIPAVKGSRKLKTEDRPARHEVTEEFNATVSFSVHDGTNEWGYSFSGTLPVGESLAACTAVNFAEGTPAIAINSERADPKKAEVGVGIDWNVGKATFLCKRDGLPTMVDVAMMDGKGKRVVNDSVKMDDLAFKIKSRPVKIPCPPGG